jgi:hypothetical protein
MQNAERETLKFQVPGSKFKVMKIEEFEDLEIWQVARELCKFVFSITLSDAFKKDFKFRDQIRAS